MHVDDEMDYCARREAEERAAAAAASCVSVHDAHFVMAERYADRASSLFESKFDAEYSATGQTRTPSAEA